MSVKDSTAGYGSLSIALHWIGAALVIALFILGNRLEDIPKGPDFIAARCRTPNLCCSSMMTRPSFVNRASSC